VSCAPTFYPAVQGDEVRHKGTALVTLCDGLASESQPVLDVREVAGRIEVKER